MFRSLSLIAFLPLSLFAQTRDAVIDQTIATLSRVVECQQVVVSPDGTTLAYTLHHQGGLDQLYVGNEILTAGAAAPTDESDPAFSPDSKEIAFVSGGSVYVAARKGKPRKLTNINASFSNPKWSPDGKKIAVLAIENASRKGGALVAMTPPSGDVETQIEEQRIAIIDVVSKTLTFATPGDMYVFDYDWSPDSKSLAAEAVHGSGDDNYWFAALYRFDVAPPSSNVSPPSSNVAPPPSAASSLAASSLAVSSSARAAEGSGATLIYKPTLQIANPRWSPDGKSIAFIEGLMSDEGSTGGDVFVVPASGGAATNITPGLRASATSLDWIPNSHDILIGENINGRSGFARVSAAGVTQLWSGEEKISRGGVIAVSLARDGVTTAVIRESYSKAPNVWIGPIGEWKQFTHMNDGVQPLWGRAENLNWTNDSFRVQGWLLYPSDVAPPPPPAVNRTPAGEGAGAPLSTKKLPMVVQVHGGPSSGVVPSWPSLNLAALVASGYAVLMPNPRGSYGQGEDFTQANVKDFGRGDFRDILTGVDAAIAHAPIDKDRVGVWGWSYGGYMTMWAVTQTTRFRAAVAGAGIVNWESYYGQNSIDQWMIPFFGATVYDDPWIYRRSSPIAFIKNAKTPTLVLVGDRDGEVPAPQSFEFWHALKTLGVKTKLVVYPNEGHRFVKPEHRRDVAKRLVSWFDDN
jgi:dipeptidyl aminopeptidase/acylaminoacyl peptidase